MIYYIDNFLPEEQFKLLQKRVHSRFVATDKKKLEANSDEPVRLTYHDVTGNWKEGCNFLGHECKPAIEKIISTFNNLGVTELLNWSVWFQYIKDTMTIPVHQDQALRKSSHASTYTALIYTSHWEPGYGGEFVVGDPIIPQADGRRVTNMNITQVVDPLPNRMLIWSRDEWHAVNKVTVNDPTYLRTFMGTGWSSIEDSKIYRNIM